MNGFVQRFLAVAAAAAAGLAVAAHVPMTDGEVRKVDRQNAKLTLKHGEIVNLGMPAMTMVFRVADPALLDRLEPGARVRFAAEKDGAGYRVTEIEPAR